MIPVDAVTGGWWDATRSRRLVLQICVACAAVQHPPRSVCTACGGDRLAWREASGRGSVDAWTTVRRSPGPGFDPPYVVARIRLDEGPVLLSGLPLGPHTCGDRVHVTWRPLDDGRHLPVFEPDQP